MSKKEMTNKFLPLAILSLVLSFVLGLLTFFLVDKKTSVHADKILTNVKEQFKADGPIEGSWIEMTKVPWKKHSYDTKVYYGGISRFEDGEIAQYEFVADAFTGALMDIYKV